MYSSRCASPISGIQIVAMVITLLSIAWGNALAQPPDSNWLEFYGGAAGDDAVYAAVENSNWTYFLAGHTETFGIDGKSDFWLLKVNIFGDTLWTRTYGGALREVVSAMQPTPDGGCIMAGYTQSYGEGLSDIYIVRTGATGNVVRSTNYGGESSDQAYDIQPTSDGGYIITGYTAHVPDPVILGDQVFLLKTDHMGDVIWARSYGQEFQDYGRSVKQTSDGGYIIAGNTWTDYAGPGHSELLLLKTDASGAVDWWKEHGFAGDDFGFAVFQNADGGYTAIGDTEQDGVSIDVYIVRTDADGNEINWEHYGGPGADYARDAKRTSDGNIIAAGYTYSWITGTDPDNYVLKVTENGDSIWAKSYAWTENLREFGYGVLPTSDQGYLVMGRTDYNGLFEDDGFVLKLGGFIQPHVFRQYDLGINIDHLIYVEDTMWVGFGGGGAKAGAQTVVSVELLLDTLLHTATGDLEITLEHLGVTDTMVYRAGGTDTNFIDTRLSDGATVPVAAGAGPFTSLYRPYKPLSAFAGLDPDGAWILRVTDVVAGNDGTLEAWGLSFNVDAAASVEPRDATVPEEFTLHQNYPNPFNPETRIDIDLPEPAFVTLEIFDILGRKVATLFNETLAAGSYKTSWNAADHPSGVYFYRVTRDGHPFVGKMLLLK